MSTPSRIRVKVCGMTRVQDVVAAVELGVDAIGMILHAQSPRKIDLATAQAIRAQVPAFVSLVGVFVNADIEMINSAVDKISLDLVQLHGEENADYAAALNAPYIKAIRANDKRVVEQEIQRHSKARAILLDPYVEGQHGGTGQALDLALWPQNANKKLILAGGLSPNNIRAACESVSPYAVDINSGVESAPGIKDIALLAAAIKALPSSNE